MMRKIKWDGPILTVRGHKFIAATFIGAPSSRKRLIIWKDRPLLEALAAILDEVKPQRIFELGIARGGSTGFIGAYARPKKLLAVDFSSDPVKPLAHFINAAKLTNVIFPFYGVDQADADRLRALAQEIFAGEPLDLVIDDASHRLVETRSSFETLFPMLRPGGVYTIEDWQWGLQPLTAKARAEAPGMDYWPTGQSLALLAMELVLAAANTNGVIKSVSVDRHFVKVVRGPGDLDKNFRLADLYPPEASELLGRHAVLDE